MDLHNPLAINARRTSYIRGSVFSWGLPLLVVVICVALQMTNTGNVRYGKFLIVQYIGKTSTCQQALVFEFRTQELFRDNKNVYVVHNIFLCFSSVWILTVPLWLSVLADYKEIYADASSVKGSCLERMEPFHTTTLPIFFLQLFQLRWLNQSRLTWWLFNQSDCKITGWMILFRAVIGLLLQFMSLAQVIVTNTPYTNH